MDKKIIDLTNFFKIIEQIAVESLKKQIPNFDKSILEEDGKIYYMNDVDGTLFDCKMNNRLCEFMAFYKETQMGALRINVNLRGATFIYVYDKENSNSYAEGQTIITQTMVNDAAIALYVATDKQGKFGPAISDINPKVEVTSADINEFNSKLLN